MPPPGRGGGGGRAAPFWMERVCMLKLCWWWGSVNESEVGHWYNQPRRDLTLVNPAKRRVSSAVLSLPHPLRS